MKRAFGPSAFVAILGWLLFMTCNPAAVAEIKDAESLTHGDEAASYQVVDIYGFPGFKVIQFNLAVLSHYSYMLISDGKGVVVDPGRDVFTYLKTAEKEGAAIQGVFLTHSHADFVAGHIELAKSTGCPIYASATSGAKYPFEPMKEGTALEWGQAVIKIVETPGHTPDGVCAVVYSRQNPDSARLIFTGDTLFVGSVGRPDLLEGKMSAASLASMMYDTWTTKLSKVNENAMVLPAHGAGSLCGAHLSDKPNSTIAEEKASNPYLRHRSRGEFIAAVLEGLPDAPQYFKHNAALNREGPPLVDWKADQGRAEPLSDLVDPSKYFVVDIRDPKEYAAAHIPNSVNIGLRGRLETWIGIMVPWDAGLVLCGGDQELKEALYRLNRIGYHATSVVMEEWQNQGLPVSKKELIAPSRLYELMQKGQSPVIVDVRLPNEWMGLRIGTVLNLPLNRLDSLSAQLDPSLDVVTVCNSAYRSSMAVGVLERKGFRKISSLDGGSEAWINAGLPVFKGSQAAASSAHPPSSPQRQIALPERISASELKRLLMDLPGTFDLVDIRPAHLFADYHLPGSSNVSVAEAIDNPSLLTGAGPLVIVDRDGSIAMAVGGILSQKTKRSIKVLYGGLEAYWRETELQGLPTGGMSAGFGAGPKSSLPPHAGKPSLKDAAPKTVPAAPAAPAPTPPKKRSAGC